MRPRAVGSAVDSVDHPGLGPVGSRQGEVGVAAGLGQEAQLLVDPAPAAVGAAVVKAPVAVHEAVGDPGSCLGGQQGAVARKVNASREQLGPERLGGVAVVMEVQLDLTQPLV